MKKQKQSKELTLEEKKNVESFLKGIENVFKAVAEKMAMMENRMIMLESYVKLNLENKNKTGYIG